jgi:hypothetical protein
VQLLLIVRVSKDSNKKETMKTFTIIEEVGAGGYKRRCTCLVSKLILTQQLEASRDHCIYKGVEMALFSPDTSRYTEGVLARHKRNTSVH